MAPSMHVAVDARCTKQMSVGMQRYARELAHWLPRVAPDLDFTILTDGENFGLAEQVRLPLAARRARADLMHHCSLYAPLLRVMPTVVTIHDLIHLQFPHYFKAHVAPYYHVAVRALLAQARRVITDDDRTVEELHRRLGVNPKKIRVIALGVDDALLNMPDREDDGFSEIRPYIFYAGNHRPHKNLATLCRAWALLPDAVNFDLVLTGEDDFAADVTRRRANGAKLFCVGNLSEAKLRQVLQGATALVYPSLCEGFGLPMLEALAVGTAVIAAADAVPRVIANECTVVPTRDVAAWAAAIAAVQSSAPAERAARRAAVHRFSWERCARETAQVYREIAEHAAA